MTCSASSSDPRGDSRTVSVPPGAASGPVLILCAVEEELRVVLAREGRVLAARTGHGAGAAMGFLAPAVAWALKETGTAPSGLAGVACVRGPGSFSGIRASLAMAEGMRLGAGVPVWGLDYLPLVARRAFALRPGVRLAAAAVHARRGTVSFQAFAPAAGGDPVPLHAPRVVTASLAARSALELFAAKDGAAFAHDAVIAGSGLRNNRAAFAACLPEAFLMPDDAAFPGPETLAAAASGPARAAPLPAEPLYLRVSDAEENLADIARARGMDPATAEALLAAALSSSVS